MAAMGEMLVSLSVSRNMITRPPALMQVRGYDNCSRHGRKAGVAECLAQCDNGAAGVDAGRVRKGAIFGVCGLVCVCCRRL